MQSKRTAIVLAALAALLLLAAPATANYRVGISEQDPRVFSQPAYQALKLKRVRFTVWWDYYKDPGQKASVTEFMDAARAANQDVLVMLSGRRGCWANGRYSKARECGAPSSTAYRSAFRTFRRAFPWVRTYAPWNEANHASQPTAKSPRIAARYYDIARKECGSRCTVMAADVLDSSTVSTWLRSFLRYSKGKGRIWGLHNYKDVNRRQSKGLTNVLKTVPGEVWLTETGGITRFDPDFPRSNSRAAARTKYMFQLADRFDSRRKGYRSKLTRVYVYRWFGEHGTWDSGLTDPDGARRPALTEFEKYAKRRLK